MLDRIFGQYRAFDEVTLPCDRCERDTPLAYLQPVANLGVGFVCHKCLITMPPDELRMLRASRGGDQ